MDGGWSFLINYTAIEILALERPMYDYRTSVFSMYQYQKTCMTNGSASTCGSELYCYIEQS